MNVFGTCLLFGLAPEWLHISYTVQILYLLPLRVGGLLHTEFHLSAGNSHVSSLTVLPVLLERMGLLSSRCEFAS